MATPEQLAKYEMTIGIECHVQLNTRTKLFSGVDNDAREREPNTVVSPVDYALPGTLPILNREAVDKAILAGAALGSKIANVSRFDRKHYFYPDLPKGYQISQMYQPIIGAGVVDVYDFATGETSQVRIEHAHLEEDAGKLSHASGYSLVDLNRCGTPLIEIVSMPDIHSSTQAKNYAATLHRLMVYAGVTNGDLYHGNMRFDVNISCAPKGSKQLGTRSEVKNLNSFKSVQAAADFEFNRQVELLEAGKKVNQETRGWDEAKQKTTSQRSKEYAQDYRYMPDPDIPPVVLSDEHIAEVASRVPTMPHQYRASWESMNLDSSVVESLLDNPRLANKLTQVLDGSSAKLAARVAHWFTLVLATDSELDDEKVVAVPTEHLVELATMADQAELSSTAAKDVFIKLGGSKTPRQLAKEMNLLQVSDTGEIEKIVDEVLALPEASQAVADIKAGEFKAVGFLVGLVMKHSKGKANPGLAQQVIREKLR
ncbi:MAG: Asp-tRNA(Asn)/Glu-tRNA(Gln) amidotransferase subunit GatB [Candidatus Nomurabacteria bacterium]|jgi:aspartyl-tRNA(Asn)/glutamyl-tRNA(Gln) amidotransferase subunit B|nr:Asp-tRNA(Asn)/Glu-tRNA(Gln) amidotransferase subunit GatB [Candidatus Nomurabacteria bacterium]